MERQPYIYTLPEAFISDKSVPMRWKLYALVNGYWISNLTAYASNRFFAEKLGCSERHIQGCLEDLEKLGVLTRKEISTGRILLPGGTNPEFVGGRTQSSERDEPRVRPISDSISVQYTYAAEDGDEVRGSAEVLTAFRRFNPSNVVLNRKNQADAARRMIVTHGLEKVLQAVDLAERTFDTPFVSTPTTPLSLEANWAKFLSQVSKKKREYESPKVRGRGLA